MKKLLPLIMLLMAAPASADIIHKMSSSVQLDVHSAATNATRMGNTFSISGSNITTSDGTTDGALGGLGLNADGTTSLTAITATQTNPGEAFSYSQSYTQGDAILESAPAIGEVGNFSNITSTAAGSHTFSSDDGSVDLSGTIDTAGTIELSPGGAGTTAIGQFVTELTIR